jgi:predicted  nucleic acid-binding Zn-ribbon protein
VAEEKQLKEQLKSQEESISELKKELEGVQQQVKDKEQEYRINDLKIRDLKRQMPAQLFRTVDTPPSTHNKQK